MDGAESRQFNAEFICPTSFDGNAFVPWIGGGLDDILRERFERIGECGNCVSFAGMKLQIPADRYRATMSRPRFQASPINGYSQSCTGRASGLRLPLSACKWRAGRTTATLRTISHQILSAARQSIACATFPESPVRKRQYPCQTSLSFARQIPAPGSRH